MTAADGRKRLTDVADTEQLLRIIQSIPLSQGGTLQTVAGSGGLEAHGGDHRPGAGHRQGPGYLPEKGLLGGVGPPAPAGHPYPK